MPLRINEGDELQRHILLQREVREEVLAEMETQQRSQESRQLTIRETFERAFPDYVSIDHGDPAGDRPSVLTQDDLKKAAVGEPLQTLSQMEEQMENLIAERRNNRSRKLAYADLPIQIYIDHGDCSSDKSRQPIVESIRSAWRSLRKLLRIA